MIRLVRIGNVHFTARGTEHRGVFGVFIGTTIEAIAHGVGLMPALKALHARNGRCGRKRQHEHGHQVGQPSLCAYMTGDRHVPQK